MKAIISVFDKSGVVEFAEELVKLGIEIISSGGTYSLLKEKNIPVQQVSEITGFAECLDGRVKTLHPKIHGGILANRSLGDHMETIQTLGIPEIDLVVVNLYPFKSTIAKPDHTFADAIENIDIGGPTMIRAAAKNHEHVLVVTDVADYDQVVAELKAGQGQAKNVDPAFKLKLAQKAFSTTAQYDIMIANYLEQKLAPTEDQGMAETVLLTLEKKQGMRYGENPHQAAAYYTCDQMTRPGIESAEILHGKELSYNNYNDAQGALDLALEFTEPVCVAVKHATPCAVASSSNILEAYQAAYASDPVSIFGGIVCVNGPVDTETAREMNKIFLEVIIAPDYEAAALEILQQKQNIRLLKLPSLAHPEKKSAIEYKTIGGGFLAQERNAALFDPAKEGQEAPYRLATKVSPSPEQIKDLEFAMKVVKHVKSNAIVVAKNGRTLGIGGGQVSRIWAAEQALERAGAEAAGAVLASDAFFPFRDVVDLAAEKGIAAIIQPGGSLKDQDSIDACDEHGMTMLITGLRHFRH